MVVSLDLHEIYPKDLSFTPQASSLISTSLGQTNLLKNDLLGLWLLAQAHVHPPQFISLKTNLSAAEIM